MLVAFDEIVSLIVGAVLYKIFIIDYRFKSWNINVELFRALVEIWCLIYCAVLYSKDINEDI